MKCLLETKRNQTENHVALTEGNNVAYSKKSHPIIIARRAIAGIIRIILLVAILTSTSHSRNILRLGHCVLLYDQLLRFPVAQNSQFDCALEYARSSLRYVGSVNVTMARGGKRCPQPIARKEKLIMSSEVDCNSVKNSMTHICLF